MPRKKATCMPESRTLRDIMGLGDQPSAWKNSALVMIDCQNTYRRGMMQLAGVEEAIDEAKRLLNSAREASAPIFHIMHDAGPGSPYDITADIGQIAEPVAPRANEPVIVKHYPNSFIGTELDALLREQAIQNLILAGFMTHMCVNSTARGAFNLGYRATVVASATATRDLMGPDGTVVPASSLHAASLAALSDLFAVVVPRADDIPS
jgi:nicotinamidase-related amidase